MLMPRFFIVGGYITISKAVFVKEMLSSDSRIRDLLKMKASDGINGSRPGVCSEGGETVTLDFSDTERIDIGESPEEIIGQLKSKYREKIKGKVTCRGTFYCFEIDLNSDEGIIDYVME